MHQLYSANSHQLAQPTQPSHSHSHFYSSHSITGWHSNHPHWHSTGTGHANTRPIRVWSPIYLMEQVLYGTWPKCLNRGWFRQSIFKKMPLQTDPLCNSANPRPTYQPETSLPIPILHQSSNPMTILQSWTCPPIQCLSMVNPMPIRGHLHK